ncbi:SpoIIE family protein phosphatase [Acidothermus cellulolyticus]|uniref:SpoIIE family protein phosphatase n=1 Tax=Acidothermus cellulolyticus TaxID=28049 RepID=UPI0002D74BEA|nr:SpoIIE family protein phosphatase [Acidothermus cellulolyticus]
MTDPDSPPDKGGQESSHDDTVGDEATTAARPASPEDVDAHLVIDSLVDAVLVVAPDGRIVLANSAAEKLLGAEPGSLSGAPLLDFVPQRYQRAHCAGFERYVRTGEGRLPAGQAVDVAARRRDGVEIPVEIRFGRAGKPTPEGFSVVGVLREVTERIRLERAALLSRYLQAVVEAAPDGVIAWSPDLTILAVNRRFTEMCRLPSEAIPVGGDVVELLQRYGSLLREPQRLLDAFEYARRNPTEAQSLELTLADGRIVETYGAPITDESGTLLGRVWYVHDATERRAAEAHRDRLLRELAAVQRAQQFLLDASTVLARVSGFSESLHALAAAAVPALGDICIVDVLVDDGRRIERVAAVHADPTAQPLVDDLRRRFPPRLDGDNPAAQVLRDGVSRWAAEMSDDFLRATTRNEEHYQLVRALGYTSFITVPMIADGQVLGSITLVSTNSHRRFTDEDVKLAEELARRAALVVAKERRYDAERRLSHNLQASLLPSDLPVFPGVDYAVCFQPGTRDAEVGGDFWDVTTMPDGEVAIMVGDVAGHDMQAAAMMAQLRAACRAIRAETRGPDELVARLHAHWDQLGLARMASAVFARLRPWSGLLRVASAGHPPPLIVEDGRPWFVPIEPSTPFGAPGGGASLWQGTLSPGAVAVFYTDGLVEDRHRDIDDGMARLAVVVTEHWTEPASAIADHVISALLGPERADDVAVLVLRWLGPICS